MAEDGGGLARRENDDGPFGCGEGTALRLFACEYLAIYATRNIVPPRVPESETLSAVTLPWTGGNDRRSLGNRHIHAMGRFTRRMKQTRVCRKTIASRRERRGR